MLNSIGLQNPGVDAVLERYAPRWASWLVPVIVNVAGESVEDYVAVARKLDGVPGVAGIELNISCPNVGRGGLQFALDAEAAGQVTAAVRAATDLPLMVKLSPAAADVRAIAAAIEDAGADAISAVNTLSGMAIDRRRRRPLLGNTYGGLSGPGAQAGRAAGRLRGGPAGATSRSSPSAASARSTTCSTSCWPARARCRSGRRSSRIPALPLRLVDELRDVLPRPRARLPPGADRRGAAQKTRSRPSIKGVEYRP